MVQETRKLHSRDIKMIKDDQGGTRNPYKCMNVMKQDAMDDKIKERCKTYEKQCMQEDLDWSTNCREAIKDPEEISMNPPSCREAIKIVIRGSWKAR